MSNAAAESLLLASDARARDAALDATRSFIVQAPAGSGKTELLIQRLLAVLSAVDQPAAVLAITFTNKAAGEMRERLQAALLSAQRDPEGLTLTREVERQRHRLARAVLDRDAERGWNLLDRPDALLIDTFDAFCARIAARAPLQAMAHNAALAPITDDPGAILRDAAREALFDPDIVEASTLLLRIAANRVDDLIGLLADLLARRAQWLGEAVDTSDAAVARLSVALQAAIESRITTLAALWHRAHDSEIRELAAFSAQVLAETGEHDAAERRAALAEAWPPEPGLPGLWGWRVLADWLLTAGGDLRKPGGVRVDLGFPPGSSKEFPDFPKALRESMKARMQALLVELEGQPGLASALAAARALPGAEQLREHATTLRATLVVLRQAAAHLSVQLRERGVSDFSAVVLAASAALQDSREEVLAGLDARLTHVLVDEVQDTNPAQFELLAALTSDWSQGDGRTLFLVGDPMQSIYGFRDADVSLFLRAQRLGIGAVALTPLTLAANYRSQPAVIDWVNRELAAVFAQQDGSEPGEQVSFAPAVATRLPGSAVERVQQQAYADELAEARGVAELVASLRADEPDASIAVLVRSRAHASTIIAELRRRQLPFAAREFADWAQRERVRDLLALTFAITSPGDRLSLFALLRSPWVGCTLATLAALAAHLDGAGRSSTGIAALSDVGADSWQATLDDDARARIAHAAQAFAVAQARAWLSQLSERVEAAWQALGGARYLDAAALAEADSFFRWLDRVASGGLLPPRHELAQRLQAERQSFAARGEAGAAAGTLEILTIHKAKGLEWDHVILPGCDRAVRPDTRSLAQWRFIDAPTARDPHARAVLIAARDTRRREAGSVYDFVAGQRAAARRAESKRLLYVAATRARRTLTLTRCAAFKAPPAESFAGLLGEVADTTMAAPTSQASQRLVLPASLQRYPLPAALAVDAIRWPAYPATAEDASLLPPQQQLDARALGIVGHLLFEGLALQADGFAPDPKRIEHLLREEGAASGFSETAAQRLAGWFRTAHTRDTVRFLFATDHAEASNELSLIDNNGDELRVDRTFVTAAGERWLIDFKFGEPPPAMSVTAWLADEMARHSPQLRRYARLLSTLDAAASPPSRERPLRVALYYPWLDRLHELGAGTTGAEGEESANASAS